MYKIVGVSNYGDPSVEEILVCESISSDRDAELIKNVMNGKWNNGVYYYDIKPQDYELKQSQVEN